LKVLPLKGVKSLRALNAFSAVLLGLKMLPAYMSMSYPDFLNMLEQKTPSEKETLIREGVAFVQLAEDEVEALLGFVADPNGIPYTKVNMGNLGPKEFHECIVAVLMEISRIDINLVSEAEKKSYPTGVST
jgi:hypothetical protein